MGSRILSLVLGSLLVAAAPCGFARNLGQERSEANAGSPNDGGSQQTGSQDQATDGKAVSTQATDQSAEPNKSGQTDSSSDMGKDQSGKPAHGGSARHAKKNPAKVSPSTQQQTAKTGVNGKSPIQNAAEQILSSLDVAINVMQKSGNLAGASAGKKADDISARRGQLQQKMQTAKDDSAWTDVAAGGAGVLADTLKLIDTTPGSMPNSSESETNRESIARANDQESGSRSSHLSLYVAGLSLIFSVVALVSGWLLARREINKALIEAGLL